MAYRLTVTCKPRDFNAYWYGIGELVVSPSDYEFSRLTYDSQPETFVVDYGDDQYRAQYQADRFGSGLIFAKVEEV